MEKGEVEVTRENRPNGVVAEALRQTAVVGGVEFYREVSGLIDQQGRRFVPDLELLHFHATGVGFRCGNCLGDAFRVRRVGYDVEAACILCGFAAELGCG